MTEMQNPRDTVLTFLHAMWRSDLVTATSLLAPEAKCRLPRSMAGEAERDAPAAPTIEWMMKELFSQFVPPRGLVIEVRRVMADGETVMVEYGGSGTLASGAQYANDYVMSVTTARGLVVEMRPYGDTKYIHKMLFPAAA
jgi:ketosteroid isomerase-like protein